MNGAGRDALRAAALAGVRQIRGKLAVKDGRCAMGVLEEASGLQEEALIAHYDLLTRVRCPLCVRPIPRREAAFIMHVNDRHRLDFFKIAELMPVTDAAP